MTGSGNQPLDEVAELADRIAATAAGCPDVARLTQSPDIPVATYLPGRTVVGVAVRPAEVEICVVAGYGRPLAEVAAQVRRAVRPLAGGRVIDVVIGDIAEIVPAARRGSPGGRRGSTNGKRTEEVANG